MAVPSELGLRGDPRGAKRPRSPCLQGELHDQLDRSAPALRRPCGAERGPSGGVPPHVALGRGLAQGLSPQEQPVGPVFRGRQHEGLFRYRDQRRHAGVLHPRAPRMGPRLADDREKDPELVLRHLRELRGGQVGGRGHQRADRLSGAREQPHVEACLGRAGLCREGRRSLLPGPGPAPAGVDLLLGGFQREEPVPARRHLAHGRVRGFRAALPAGDGCGSRAGAERREPPPSDLLGPAVDRLFSPRRSGTRSSTPFPTRCSSWVPRGRNAWKGPRWNGTRRAASFGCIPPAGACGSRRRPAGARADFL